MTVILIIPAGFSEVIERVRVPGARTKLQAVTEALKSFPRNKRSTIKTEVTS